MVRLSLLFCIFFQTLDLNLTHVFPFPVSVTVKGRTVRVFGKRGKLVRKFKQAVDIKKVKAVDKDGNVTGDAIELKIWFGRKKDLSSVRTITSHISNMFTGVTQVFTYDITIRPTYAYNLYLSTNKDFRSVVYFCS